MPPNEEIDQEAADHFYYFAYGSNLLTERMRISNPSAAYVCNGALMGFRLAFATSGSRWGGGPATILEDPGAVVCGVVWKLSGENSKSLDIQETGYRRLYVDVKILPLGDEYAAISNGHTVSLPLIRCRTYEMLINSSTLLNGNPSPYYKRVMLVGSKEHKLPLEYRKRLEAVEDNGYKGPIGIRLTIFENEQI